jgi:hypothetical protein
LYFAYHVLEVVSEIVFVRFSCAASVVEHIKSTRHQSFPVSSLIVYFKATKDNVYVEH